MSALAAVFCRTGGTPAPDGFARMADALHGFGTRRFVRGVGAAGLIRNVPEGFTPEDASDRGVAEVGDGRLLRILDTWPATTPLSPADHPDHQVAQVGIDRALATGCFIRWVTGEGGGA